MSDTITTEKELRDFLRNKPRAVVLYGKDNCLHCSIVESVLGDVEKHYPLIAFGYTNSTALADKLHINAYPVLIFYENGAEQGRLIGSGKITFIKDMLNIWFKKD